MRKKRLIGIGVLALAVFNGAADGFAQNVTLRYECGAPRVDGS
jgi:hypothetical protein